jgi:hypothetical protein
MKFRATVFLVPALLLSVLPAHGAAPTENAPTRALTQDLLRRIDVNRINMFVSNFGAFGFDIANGNSGLFYPKGETKTALFAGGLWLGAVINPGTTQVTVSEYSSEYGPGRILSPGVWEDPNLPDIVVFKMKAWTGDPQDSAHVEIVPADPTIDPIVHHGWAEYMAGAATRGAPVRAYKLPLTSTPDPEDSVLVLGPDVTGDQMLWSVYNDADPAFHYNDAGHSAPIGVEVHQTVFGFDRPGPLGDAVFIRYRIINKGTETILRLDPGVWTDPDIGAPADDMIGADVPRSMGYAFNAVGQDAVYTNTPPALGVRLLDGLPMEACTGYVNGTDPQSTDASANALRGLNTDGSPIIDPVADAVTPFMFPGDPVTGQGWTDGLGLDKRLLVTANDKTLAPSETTEVLVAIVVGRGTDHIASISQLRCNADFAALSHGSGFTTLDPAPGAPPCFEPSACPRPLSYWQDQCTGGSYPGENLQLIAQAADAQSAYFEWSASGSVMCATLHSTGATLREEAERQFAALLANVMAARYGVHDPDGEPIILSPLTPTVCPGVEGETVADLVRTGQRGPRLTSVSYVNANFENPPGLGGVNFGLPFFGGGGGYAVEFLGSSLDPAFQPDSFANVQIRFSTVPQKAYRYLRYERASDGSPPPQGRRYFYGGFHDVPFQVWDVDRNVQLEAAFVERVLTDDDGTILPSEFQPATLDFTWGPDFSELGGREYVLVFRPAYSGIPDAAFEIDDVTIFPYLPGLYAMASRLLFDGAVIDPGDFVRFRWTTPIVNSIDQMMIDLELLPPDDPAAEAGYANIINCIAGLKDACDIPTAVLVSLVQATASPEVVELAWHAPGLAVAQVQRFHPGGDWLTIAVLERDGLDRIVWGDRDIVPGERYGYRLVDEAGHIHAETWVSVPTHYRLALAGTQPNPAVSGARVVLSLPRRGPARLDVIDVAGRRVASRDLSDLSPGTHQVRVAELDRLPAGVYMLKLSQGSESAIGRMVRIQ